MNSRRAARGSDSSPGASTRCRPWSPRCRAKHLAYGVDVTDTAAIIAAGRAFDEAVGGADIVIANAGISVGVKTEYYEDLAQFRRVFETNVISLAATFHPFIAPMKTRRRGTLVGIASVAGIRGLPGSEAYCASKSAVITYCESLRVELAKARRQGRDDFAGLHPHAADGEEPLRHALPDGRQRSSPARQPTP